ncbi:MAG: PKD domain-containing protein, partial [Dehalococcoidia bacterium]|nr:PKD domain-containing protein [Dehalococcoidia bacterium]
WGWRGDPSCYQTTYTTMRGLHALNIDAIDSIDWFQDFWDALRNEQAGDGWWLVSRWDTGDRVLSTAWAMLTLQKVVAPSPPLPRPVADADGPYLVEVNLPVTLDGSSSYDPDGGEIVDYHWIFGDGNTGSGVSPTNTYNTAGLYTAELTVTDDVGGIDTATAMVVVYDPDAGFATGGGWFIPDGATSDEGDWLPDMDKTSPANFGFEVKYKKGASNPNGQLEFQYPQGNFNLHSKAMDWLVIVNNWAKFQGTATIKGFKGLYPFRVDARDGDFGGGTELDRFIIKVYAPDADPDKDDPIYKASGDLEGGSIVIHAKKVKVTTLRVQSGSPADMLGYQVFETWAETISKTSGGRLQIEPYPAGAIVPTSEMYDAVQSGVLDGFVAGSMQWTGKHALANYLTSYPFGLDEPYMWEIWFYDRGGIELAREDYARFNMHYIGPVMGAPEYAHCVKPLDAMADWNGLKCRYAGGMTVDIFEKAGAEVFWMSGGEIYQAMATGFIELGEFSSHYMNKQLGLHEVGPNIIGPAQMHSAVSIETFVVNMDTWNSLSPKLQQLLTTGVSDLSTSTLSALQAADIEALQWMIQEAGCTYIEIPPVERAEFRLISVEFWSKYATDVISLQAVESQILLMSEEGLLDFPGLKAEVEIYFPGLLP